MRRAFAVHLALRIGLLIPAWAAKLDTAPDPSWYERRFGRPIDEVAAGWGRLSVFALGDGPDRDGVIAGGESPARRDLPSGTVTFLFTDIEGSTRLLREMGAHAYAEALAEHRRTLREAVKRHAGAEVDTQGDAFFVAFPTAEGALAAARQAVERLAAGPIRVRIGIHTGTPHLTDEGYVGTDVHRAARIAAAGHGGQVLVSGATAALVRAIELRDLGEHRLKDLSALEHIYQLGPADFPPQDVLAGVDTVLGR